MAEYESSKRKLASTLIYHRIQSRVIVSITGCIHIGVSTTTARFFYYISPFFFPLYLRLNSFPSLLE